MIEIRGLYNTALCYTSALEEKAAEQIRTVCDQEEFAGCRIRIMPDVHAGKGCTIGTTMTISDKVVPGMVGVDIGCGMETVRLAEREIDFAALDALIRREVPSGRNVRGGEHRSTRRSTFPSFAARTASRSTGRGAASARSAAATTSSRSTAPRTAHCILLSTPAAAISARRSARTIRSRDSLPCAAARRSGSTR